MDIASLGLAVDSSQVERGTVTLTQLTGAAGAAERAARGLAVAESAEASGMKAATAATQAHTAAMNLNNASMRSGAAQRTNLIFQLNDVGVSLASGMNPLMVLVQQGSQIATIYKGGVVEALKETVKWVGELAVRFWPVAAAVAAVSAVIGGLQHEINKTADVQVSFFDVALAGWQLFAESVASLVAPVFNQLGGWLAQAWDAMVPILKQMGNGIIAPFAFGVKAIGTLWQGLPAALGDVMITTANVIVKGVEYSINKAAELLDGFIGKANEGLAMMPGGLSIPSVGRVDFGGAANPYAGALGKLGNNLNANATDASSTDYMGNMFGAISDRAQAIAKARGEVEALGGAAAAANDNIKAIDDTSKSLAETWGGVLKSAWQGFFADFNAGLKQGKGFWDALGDAGMNALSKIIDKALEMSTNGIWDLISGAIGNMFGGIGTGSNHYMPGINGPLLSVGQNANGTDNWRGGLSWVGERGPELLNLPRGAQVIPNGPSMAMAANNNTSVVRIELSGDLEGRILQQSGQQSVQIVRAAAPSIADQGASGAGSKLASGDFDRSMSRYGVQPQARRR